MGAVAHGECQTCGSRAPVELAARLVELEATLRTVRAAIYEKADDTFWLTPIETVVDRIDAVLGDYAEDQSEMAV